MLKFFTKRLFSLDYKKLRVNDIQALNRDFQFEETLRLYELDQKSKSEKAKAQYSLAKIYLKLIESNKSNQSPSPVYGTYQDPIVIKVAPIEYNPMMKNIVVYSLLALILGIWHIKKYDANQPETVSTTFSDVKGIDECLNELKEVVNLLKNSEKYKSIGAKIPRGLLLTGEPGTGKTLLARAIAGEAGVKFFSTSGAEFDEKYVGVGAKRIRELFNSAKAVSPSIIFIDEIDSIGESRKGNNLNYTRQSLNQLLVEMDGFDTKDNVIVIAATNIPHRLDEALRRPGRFDKTIEVPIPSLKSRTEIIGLYLNKIKYDPTVSIEEIAKSTYGMTGADLANLINTAMHLAIKDGRNTCSAQDIQNAKDRILLGIASRSIDYSIDDKISVSLYEAAKVVTILNTQGADPLNKVSIIRRGSNFGITSQLPDKDKLGVNKMQVLAMIDVKIAGKVIHDLVHGELKRSSHSEKDIIEATNFVCRCVRQGLFDEFFGVVFIDDQRDLGPIIKNKVDQAAKEILHQSFERVKKLLISKKEDIRKISKKLVEKETLSRDEVLEILQKH